MAIDESAGVRDRRDDVLTTWAQSRAIAVLLSVDPMGSRLGSIHGGTIKGLTRRGLIERRPAPEVGPWAFRYHLTDAGRAVAEASSAVREWLDGWEFYRKKT